MTTSAKPLKVLYFCEGFTDIRFVVGLSEICDLDMAAPAWEFRVSGLADRISGRGMPLKVDEIHGKRPGHVAQRTGGGNVDDIGDGVIQGVAHAHLISFA